MQFCLGFTRHDLLQLGVLVIYNYNRIGNALDQEQTFFTFKFNLGPDSSLTMNMQQNIEIAFLLWLADDVYLKIPLNCIFTTPIY